jgi:hypothetical protein
LELLRKSQSHTPQPYVSSLPCSYSSLLTYLVASIDLEVLLHHKMSVIQASIKVVQMPNH